MNLRTQKCSQTMDMHMDLLHTDQFNYQYLRQHNLHDRTAFVNYVDAGILHSHFLSLFIYLT